ncbi:MAG: Gfo/Idh/MocA family oxidoreductase [Verrucomicrobia bacterium]|nr:Gfo/Idh/MocA family oxidoreductase [Verrucomicrobiota bacterium]MBV8481932.1 Gfo/Idh/MocA family oxidoreductase [Verrucomicrobiota bacterium]
MKFIVVGIGFWGRKWIELLQTFPRASVVAAVDKSEAAIEWSQRTYGIPCFPDLTAAAQKNPADAVLVVTNPSQHKPVILEALRLQKHVLVEKPMVTSMDEGLQTAAAAEAASGKVMAAQGYRFLKAAGLVRERLALGDIGLLQAVKIRFRRHLPDVIGNPEHSIYALPHSILLDMSVHHVDLLRFMTQAEVASVLAVEHDTPDNAFKHPSNALCLMRLRGDIPVVWDGDWCARGAITSWEGEWQFVGSRGRLFWDGVLDEAFRTSVRLEIPGQETQELMSVEPVQERRLPLLEHFIDSIERGQQPEPSIEDNRKTLAVVFGSLESVLKKQEVRL